jgi:hypothetical protein
MPCAFAAQDPGFKKGARNNLGSAKTPILLLGARCEAHVLTMSPPMPPIAAAGPVGIAALPAAGAVVAWVVAALQSKHVGKSYQALRHIDVP